MKYSEVILQAKYCENVNEMADPRVKSPLLQKKNGFVVNTKAITIRSS